MNRYLLFQAIMKLVTKVDFFKYIYMAPYHTVTQY